MLVALAAAFVGAGCAGDGGGGGSTSNPPPPKTCTPPATPSVMFAANVQPIFDAGCAFIGCHAGPAAVNNLDLSAGAAYGEIVNRASFQKPGAKQVIPGKPDQSYLQQKIEATPGIAGVPMPQGCPGAPLGGARCLGMDEIAAIRTWITECAQNN